MNMCINSKVAIVTGGNKGVGRETKKLLYSTSPVTEHWYIEQNSNTVECYFGNNRLENQSLSDILVTRDGLKFDLRYLAI